MVTLLGRIGLLLMLGVLVQATSVKATRPEPGVRSARRVASAPSPALQSTSYAGMFQLYDANRQQGIGDYITVDFLLTAYGLLVQEAFQAVEEDVLLPAFRQLTTALVSTLPPPDSPAPALALAYMAVLQALLQPEAAVPAAVAEQVQAEVALIMAHQGPGVSAITGVQEDYSQYIPRGHYSRSEAMQRYFRAALYAGRVGFFLRESQATGVSPELAERHTAAALLLSRTIVEQVALRQLYDTIQRLLDAFVGPSDDLTASEYAQAAGTLSAAAARQHILTTMVQAGRLPRLVSTLVDKRQLEPDRSLPEVLAGLRLIAQRYTPEAEVLQGLVYDRVGRYRGNKTPLTLSVIDGKKVRGFPSALDVLASLGSRAALQALRHRGDTAYDGYNKQLSTLAARLRQPGALASAPATPLPLLRAILAEDSPTRLNAALGLWVRTRHTLLLYTKQSYTTTAKSLTSAPERTLAAIEPAPAVYEAVSTALKQLGAVVESGRAHAQITTLLDIVQQLHSLAARQPQGVLQEPQEIAYVNDVSQRLQGLLATTDTPLVVDIHSEPNSQQVLEEGLGYPLAVVFGSTLWHRDSQQGGPAVPGPTLLRGARFQWYEFTQPMNQRLTDAAWQQLLQEGKTVPSGSLQLLQKTPDNTARQARRP